MRHLLNVWISAGKASGRRANLTKIRVQTASLRTDELDHVLAIARQRFLHRAVFEQLSDDRILRGERLQFPVARRIGERNAEPVQGVGDLQLRIEIDVRARRPE